MAKKKARKAPNPDSKSRPIAFRLDRELIQKIDHVAGKLGKARNAIVALVLKEYVAERGDAEIARIVREDDLAKTQVDLFA